MRLAFAILLFHAFISTRAQLIDKYLLWARTAPLDLLGAGASQSDIDADGNIYVIGTFYKTLDPQGTGYQPYWQFVFLLKYNSDGVLIWSKELGTTLSTSVSYAGDLRVDKTGNIVFTASFYDPQGELFGRPVQSFVLCKMDGNGNVIWVSETPNLKLFTYYHNTQSHMEIDKDNSIVLYYTNNDNDPPTVTSGLYLARYSEGGALLGEYQVTKNNNTDYPTVGGLAIDSNGNLIITGYYVNELNIGSENFGVPNNQGFISIQLFIAKFTASGSFVWARQMASNQSVGYDVETESDHIYLSGFFGADAFFNGGNQDINPTESDCGFIAYLTPDGALSWVKPFERLKTTYGNYVIPMSLKRTSSGDVFITGYCERGIGFDNFGVVRNNSQAFVMKLNPDATFSRALVSNDGPPSQTIAKGAINSMIDKDGKIYTLGYFSHHIVFGCDTLSSESSSMFLTKYSEFPPFYSTEISGPAITCSGSLLNLSTTAVPEPAKYYWTLPAGVTNASSDPPSNIISLQLDPQADNQSISLTVQKGCYSYSNVQPYQIHIKNPPGTTSISGQGIFCDPATTRFSATADANATSYVWSLPSGLVPSSGGLTTTNPFIDVMINESFDSGSISVKMVNDCGESTPSLPFPVQVIKKPSDVSFQVNQVELCNHKQVLIYTCSVSDNATEYVWTVPSIFKETGIKKSNQPAIQVTVSSGGVGKILVHGKNACHEGNPSEINFLIHDPLQKPLIQPNICSTVLETNGSSDIQWYHEGELILSGESKLLVSEEGSYLVTVSNFCGTMTSDEVKVFPISDQTIFIPNVITPNNDGKNDTFKLGEAIRNLKLDIFGRWGESVYNSIDYRNDWDGGNEPTGTYFFRLEHQCLTHTYQGWIQIIR